MNKYDIHQDLIEKLIDLHGMNEFLELIIRVCQHKARTTTSPPGSHEFWTRWANQLDRVIVTDLVSIHS